MEKPDAAGYVHITWPSKKIPHGGIFHTRVAETSNAQRDFLKVLLEESKLSVSQRHNDTLKLRERSASEQRAEPGQRRPLIRPRTSRRRSLSAIRESGIFDADQYRPIKRGEDREKMKEKLANFMAYGDAPQVAQTPPQGASRGKPKPKLPTSKQMWNDLVTQIRERTEWLAEMEYLGEAEPHRDIINDQIAERMRALDALGIDSVCSSARSTATGFSTTRSREPENAEKTKLPFANATTPNRSSAGSEAKRNLKKFSVARLGAKEESVAAYGKLIEPLLRSPRRRL